MKKRQRYSTLLFTLSKWIIWGRIIGFVIGTTTAGLLKINDFLGEKVRMNHAWLIAFLPFGGILLGYLYMKFGKDEAGNDAVKGNNLVIEGIHGKATVLRRMGPIVYVGTFITVLFGGSTGREGAAVQMGGSIAKTVNRVFKVGIPDRKILLMSGVSAGFGAAFGTPVTGAVFGMEMAALGRMKYEAFVACLVASFVGHHVTEGVWRAKHETFIIENIPEISILAFTKVIAAAIIFGLLSVLYCQLRHGIQKQSEKYFKKNHMVRAFVGGSMIVILTLMIGNQDYNGRGLEMLEHAFTEEVPAFAFFGKLVFTAITLGSGFVGGEAIPLFFMGGYIRKCIIRYHSLANVFSCRYRLDCHFLRWCQHPDCGLFVSGGNV